MCYLITTFYPQHAAVQNTKVATLSHSLRNRPDTTLHPHRGGHDVTEVLRPSTHLNPVRPPPSGHTVHTSASHPKDLNKLRQELNRHTVAWNSQSPSLVGSRNPSRQPSRQTSASSRHGSQSSISHRLSVPEFDSDIEFHEVPHIVSPSKHSSHSQKKVPAITVDSGSSDVHVHFPSIAPPSNLDTRHRSSSHGSREIFHSKPPYLKNGHWTPSKTFEFRTDKIKSELLNELQRVVSDLNIIYTDLRGSTLYLKFQGIRFQVQVNKDHVSTCHLHFQWLSGGSQEQYEDLCSQIFRSLSV